MLKPPLQLCLWQYLCNAGTSPIRPALIYPVLASRQLLRYSPSFISDQARRKMTLNRLYDKFFRRLAFTLLFCCAPVFATQSITLGPYDTQDEFTRSTAFLSDHEIPFKTNNDAVTEFLGFIVVTDQISPSEALLIIKALKSNGIKDLLYVTKGVYAERISAGIFSSQSSANNRIAKLAESGHKFVLMARSRILSSSTITVYSENIPTFLALEFEASTGTRLPESIEPAMVEDPEVTETAIQQEAESIPDFAVEPEFEAEAELAVEPEFEAEPELAVEPEITVEPEVGVEPEIEISLPAEATPDFSEPLESISPPVKLPEVKTNIVTTTQLPREQNFPLVTFVVVAVSVLILLGLAYYYFGGRMPPMMSAMVAKVRKAQSDRPNQGISGPVTRQSDVSVPLERQLDASVGAISAYANQILSGQSPTEKEIPQYLATIRSGGTKVLDLINDITELSRIENGQVDIERISFDPDSVLQDLVKSLSNKAEQKGLSLHYQAKENLPDLIACDPAKLERILASLVNHAIDHTPSGRVLITIGFNDQLDLLEVIIGHSVDRVNIDEISELFGPNDSLSSFSTEQHIRLAVSKRLSSLMGGGIRIDNESGLDIKYIITVQADEVLKKQLPSPSGVDIDELSQSGAAAHEEADVAKKALEVALTKTAEASNAQLKAESLLTNETSARTKAESQVVKLNVEKEKISSKITEHKAKLANASARVKALSLELNTAREESKNSREAASRLENNSTEDLEKTASELLAVRNELKVQINNHNESEAKANSQITKLQESLDQATKNAQAINDSERLGEVKRLEEDSARLLEAHAESEAQIEELRIALSAADSRLNEELERLAKARSDAETQADSLTVQLEAAREESKDESVTRLGLEEKLSNLTTELDETRHTLETQSAESQQEIKKLQQHLKKLVQGLKEEKSKAEVTAQEQHSQNEQQENSINSDLSQQVEIIDKLRQEVESLKAALLSAEDKLKSTLESGNKPGEESERQMETSAQLDAMAEELQKNKQALEKARGEAAQNARAVHAARLKLKQLTARELSHEQIDDQAPLRSSMPMSNPILRSMVRRFSTRFKQQLDVMATSYQQQNYLDLVVINNWLKSESLSLGFEELRPPISFLELCLRRQEFEPIENIIKQLQNMAERIEIPNVQIDDGSSLGVKAQQSEEPIPYTLPDNERKAELLENFVSQLGSKLLDMQSSWQEGNAKNLEKTCRWILKYGGRLDVPEVMESAERLDYSVKHKDVDRISQKLWDFIGVYSRIEIVHG